MAERILVVEDELDTQEAIVEGLRSSGMDVLGVDTVSAARATVQRDRWDALLVDMKLPDGDGMDLVADIHRGRPDLALIVMTGFASVERAVDAIKKGATDFVAKPFETEELVQRLRRIWSRSARAEARLSSTVGFARLVGRSPAMREVLEQARRVAASDAATVLITGESGTGKDVLARAIHEESRRASAPFMNITCTAIAETLFESELFGHEKGSFTGAHAAKKGLLELADGGTVFLDEIGDLPPSAQSKLLRFLEERAFKRVGGVHDTTVEVRIIAATNQRLRDKVAQGSFRADLFHRLNVFDIEMPPLRARGDDIELLARWFLSELAPGLGAAAASDFTPEALECLLAYPWLGNVRELRNTIERALILARGELVGKADLPAAVQTAVRSADREAPHPSPDRPVPPAPALPFDTETFRLPPAGINLKRLEREFLLQAVARSGGNKSKAARLLGLNRDQVRYRLKKLRSKRDR